MQAPSTQRTLSVAIRSRRRLFRDALASCLTGRPEFTVVGHVADDTDLLRLCALRQPDLVLFDAVHVISSSLPLLSALRDRFGATRLVVVYERLTPGELSATARLGADALVPYSHGLDALLVVLRRHAETACPQVPAQVAVGPLTEREQEIIELIGAGHTANQIADLLGLRSCLVEQLKRRIYHKLNAASQSHAIARAAVLGLVGPASPHHRGAAPAGELPELTGRERDILRSIMAGHTVRQTARSLGIATKTVENTQARLFRKLGVRNRAGAVASAHALGLLEPVRTG